MMKPWIKLFALIIALPILSYISLRVGVIPVSHQDVLALGSDMSSQAMIALEDNRIPRTVVALLVGSVLGLAGLLFQLVTRNPLASPDILAVNAGASLAIVLVTLFGFSSIASFTSAALVGAFIAGVIVYLLSANGGNVMYMTLAGASLAALFSSFTQSIIAYEEGALDEVLFWLTGSVAGRSLELVTTLLPWMVVASLCVLLISKELETLSLGDQVARSLGQNVGVIKFVAVTLAVVLSAFGVALAGPIAFVGLLAPHLARYLFGTAFFARLAGSALLGSVLLLSADIFGRLVLFPREVTVGVVLAVIGGAFFIYLVSARQGVFKS
ncbi:MULTISPECIES: FecCD family ABC transporter permease [Exiguobacterium]|uniref:FecCD family ABC transporter permease n=1 Tax=Exiguobacterium TaxID=33986 RepID=UPI001BE8442D|nr:MULTISPECIES: iron ABC transporter permease [Exiguobacterium]MCT4790055.1 iron ABC transporter permease [Exiguobacterium mexicanum]